MKQALSDRKAESSSTSVANDLLASLSKRVHAFEVFAEEEEHDEGVEEEEEAMVGERETAAEEVRYGGFQYSMNDEEEVVLL